MSGDVHVRFCERPRVRPPRATHLLTVAATPVHLAIHVPASFASRVRVSHLRVDDTHGDAYTVWVSQGMPASPSAAQVAALQQAMDPSPLVPDGTVAVAAGGLVGLDFALPRFGVSLLTVQSAPGASDGGAMGTGGGGCACGVAGRRDGAARVAVPLAMAMMALAFIVRRRCTRCAGLYPPTGRRSLARSDPGS